MRFRNLKKWKSPEKCSGLVFFAQLLEELLFDFSIDTYKPSAMNTSLLCMEVWRTIKGVNDGIINKANVEHVCQELASNLKVDPVAKSLLSVDLDQALSIIQNKTKELQEIKTIIELIINEISLKKYKAKSEELLIKEIILNNNFSMIRILTRNYITTLINFGYHPKILAEEALSYFYRSDLEIKDSNAINGFIELFSKPRNNYIAIFRATKFFEVIASSCNSFDINVETDLSKITDLDNITNPDQIQLKDEFKLKKNYVYIIVNKIEALDCYSAREKACARIEMISILLTLFHHKEQPRWDEACLIYNIENKDVKISKKIINPMHKCIDLRPEKAVKKVNELLKEFSLSSTSFNKFNKSSLLHSLALKNDSKENQMINLWISLESLIPAKEKGCKIENISNALLPFLNINYLNNLIDRLVADILYWNKGALHATLKGIPGDSFRIKMGKLLALDDFLSQRETLIAKFKNFYLLENRFNYMVKVFSSPSTIVKLIDKHDKRVRWQLRRIYRARNSIIHDGKMPSYTGILIENTHAYIDSVMMIILQLASTPKKVISIDQTFSYIEMNYKAYYKNISKKELMLTNENIEEILFKFTKF